MNKSRKIAPESARISAHCVDREPFWGLYLTLRVKLYKFRLNKDKRRDNMSFSFDAGSYRYPSRRRVVFAGNGMVCASQPLAAQAGVDALRRGGNAVDAAVAMAGQHQVDAQL